MICHLVKQSKKLWKLGIQKIKKYLIQIQSDLLSILSSHPHFSFHNEFIQYYKSVLTSINIT